MVHAHTTVRCGRCFMTSNERGTENTDMLRGTPRPAVQLGKLIGLARSILDLVPSPSPLACFDYLTSWLH
jgi:hypothetical protein